MNRNTRFAICSVTLAGFLTIASAYAQDKPEVQAQKGAESWLALVDSGKYAESWDEASTLFKGQVTKEKWVEMLKPVRDPLGKVQSRKLSSAEYKKDPPNAPAGEYVTIQFAASFENLKSATETVALALDKDGRWRVAGYFIKPA